MNASTDRPAGNLADNLAGTALPPGRGAGPEIVATIYLPIDAATFADLLLAIAHAVPGARLGSPPDDENGDPVTDRVDVIV